MKPITLDVMDHGEGEMARLLPEEWNLLRFGMRVMTDQFFSDMALLEGDGAWADTMVLQHVMPNHLRSFYTPTFVRRFVVSGLTLMETLDTWDRGAFRDPVWPKNELMGSCMAEHLVIRGLVASLPNLYATFVQKPGARMPRSMRSHFNVFWSVDDEDEGLLFDPEMTELLVLGPLARQVWMDADHLHPKGWFAPFPRGRAHPYCQDGADYHGLDAAALRSLRATAHHYIYFSPQPLGDFPGTVKPSDWIASASDVVQSRMLRVVDVPQGDLVTVLDDLSTGSHLAPSARPWLQTLAHQVALAKAHSAWSGGGFVRVVSLVGWDKRPLVYICDAETEGTVIVSPLPLPWLRRELVAHIDTSPEWALMRQAMVRLTDGLLNDEQGTQEGRAWEATEVLQHILPTQYQAAYTPAFVRRFVVSALMVMAKVDAVMSDPNSLPYSQDSVGPAVASCVAEDIMFRGLVDSLDRVWAAANPSAPMPRSIAKYFAAFWRTYAGNTVVGQFFGDVAAGDGEVAALHPEHWFAPYDERPVHPYCRDVNRS